MQQKSTIGALRSDSRQVAYSREDGEDYMIVSRTCHIRAHKVEKDGGYWASIPGSTPEEFDPNEVVVLHKVAAEEVA